MREALSDSPGHRGVARDDVLSALLSTVRLSASLQFCVVASGAWQTDATPAMAGLAGRSGGTVPFHLVAEGSYWVRMPGTEAHLGAGDVMVFPFGTGHQLGAGRDGRLVLPTRDLPQRPWREIPVLRYGDGAPGVRLLCGFLRCDALNFAPLRDALPELILLRTGDATDGGWLRATLRQMVDEVDRPRAGGVSMLPRLTEIMFIEILRHQIMAAGTRPGWLAALADPTLARCLSLIHGDPGHDWSLAGLAAAAGLSRSVLAERFQATLGTSPIRYLRDWRLYLASTALAAGGRGIAAIADDAGYATEAAFNRAFARAFGTPPAAWRAQARETAGDA